MRILIAEDEPISRILLEDALKKWGYEVIVTKNGEEAWNILQQENSPNLVILDWVMPGIDGIEVCRRVRKKDNKSYVYIILLTARNRQEDIIAGLDAGVDDYIIKPFFDEELKYRLKIGERIIELEQRILNLARIDYLTGLLNRRAFMERLEAEVGRANRAKGKLGLVILDIDFFKKVNDTYGHQAGDLVLQNLALNLTEYCRGYDFIGRYGGEEFVIGLPNADIEECHTIAERIRQQIESSSTVLPGEDATIKITASFGIAAIDDDYPYTTNRLISAADTALYLAKDSGRNLVIRCRDTLKK
ncbi:MAG TPA: diguanylate cyclase [Syntrophomonadaceae bacterium]|nr:diguanylate cyclase [Syntrophomonadaceae bacterium]